MSRHPERAGHHKSECACCALGPAAFDAHVDHLIRERGFALLNIQGGPIPYAYTVGLSQTRGVPEFIVVGNFDAQVMNSLAACVSALSLENPDALRGRGPKIAEALDCSGPDGQRTRFAIGWKPVSSRKVAGPDAIAPMSVASRRFGAAGFEARQLFVPDASGRLPWEPGFDAAWATAAHCPDLSE